MKFKNLSTADLTWIKSNGNQAEVKEKYQLSQRTVERWFSKLGMTREYRSNIRNLADIKVVDPITVKPQKSPARILIYDIETAPLKSYVWGVWQQNIGHNMGMVQQDWFMLTWAAKWLFEDKIFSDKITSGEVMVENDSRICKSLWELLEEADVVVAHNGKKFDIKRVNTRFLKNGIKQPMPYQVIDTLEIAKRNFNISSNKLDYIGEFLGVGRKVKHQGFDLWKKCLEGDSEAIDEMEVYNIGDITLLEEVYLKLRSYAKPHPNMGLYIADDVNGCPTCGSGDLERGGEYVTTTSIYEAFRCNGCGSIGRSRKSSIPVGSRKNLLVPVGR